MAVEALALLAETVLQPVLEGMKAQGQMEMRSSRNFSNTAVGSLDLTGR